MKFQRPHSDPSVPTSVPNPGTGPLPSADVRQKFLTAYADVRIMGTSTPEKYKARLGVNRAGFFGNVGNYLFGFAGGG